METTQQERAEALGITARQLRKDQRDGCPADLAGAIAWRNTHRNRKYQPQSLNDETIRLRGAQADAAELENAERLGRLVDRDEVQVRASQCATFLAGQLEALPGRMAAVLAGISDPALIRQLLLDETRKIRVAIAAQLRELAVSADGGSDRAAAGEDSGPVGGPVPDLADGEC